MRARSYLADRLRRRLCDSPAEAPARRIGIRIQTWIARCWIAPVLQLQPAPAIAPPTGEPRSRPNHSLPFAMREP